METEQKNEKKKEVTEVTIVESTAIARAEIDSQVSTARQYPRDITKFKDKLMTLANLDQETAEGCYYTLPRGGKPISGASVRFAEIALSCYGNCIAEADVVSEDKKYIYAMGQCRDLENNIAIRMKVRRRITNKMGIRFNDDMIAVTANAACSIALRNAILRVIPAAYVKSAFDKVKATAVGKAESLSARRADVLQRLAKMGADEAKVLQAVSRKSVDEITVNDLADLIGIGTAVHDGDMDFDKAFPPVARATGTQTLKEKLAEQKNGKSKAAPEPEKTTEPEDKTWEENMDNDMAKMDANIAEQTEEKPSDFTYTCNKKKCGHKFDEPAKGGLCPLCLSKNITSEVRE